MFGRPTDQRGFVMSSPLALISAGAVLLAGVAYFVTSPAKHTEVHLTAAPPAVEPQAVFERDTSLPVVSRKDTYVVVFNNTTVRGLAGRTSKKLAGAGWDVVGSDNWYGTIPATTVYYPPTLKVQGRVLARDLGIDRIKPAVDPMQMDRLTVILTDDYR